MEAEAGAIVATAQQPLVPTSQEPMAVTQQPVAAQTVGNAFVSQYYLILRQSPSLVYKFYQDTSQVGRPEEDGTMSITTTMEGINEKILSLEYDKCAVQILSVEAQESFGGGVQVLVTGRLTKENVTRYFSQVFFLAPQDRGYFVLNDIFRYFQKDDNEEGNQGLGFDLEAVPVEQNTLPAPAPAPVQEKHISEVSASTEEASGNEVSNPPETVVQVVEEGPVAEVVNEVQDETKMVVESNVKTEELPKKSYASIVMDIKRSAMAFSSPPPKKPLPKSPEKTNLLPASVPEHQSDAVDNGNNQEGEADGYSIYIKGLPMSATVSLLENEFKRFGPIRNGGIQVRSNRGFCFGFVEFEVPSAVEKALEASPITIGGGRQIVVEEKRSTNSRGNSRGRFQPGRGGGGGFRNDGVRVGRGNYGGGGRGGGVYNRGDFNGRNEFNNKGGNRGGGNYNRGVGDGYQRSEIIGSRMNRAAAGGGMANGGIKNNMIGGGGGGRVAVASLVE